MTTVLIILAIQGLAGALDNLIHHEWQARLPGRVSARRELALHAGREFLYGVLFIGLAWAEWRGWWVAAVATVLFAELVITLIDFIEEDASRRLPRFERVLHTLLTVGYGVFLMAFAPVLIEWSAQPSAIISANYGALSWLLTAYAAAVWIWGGRNALASISLYRKRAVQTAGIEDCEGAAFVSGGRRETVLVTGATGFIGTALVESLLRDGVRVIVLSRDPRQVAATWGRCVLAVDHLDLLPAETRIDAVVNLAGTPIAGGLWTRQRKRHLLESRLSVTRDLTRFMAVLTRPPKVLINASAVGYYGVRGEERLTETEPPQPIFMSQLCQDWERMALTARAAGTRVVLLRFGVVLGRQGGLFPPMSLAARFGLAAVLGNGRQPFGWLSLVDAVGLIRFAMEASALSGPVNAVAPEAITQAGFVTRLAAHLHRSVWLRIPALPVRLMMGELSQLLLEGQNADPGKVLRAGYRFRCPTFDSVLADLHPVREPRPLVPVPQKDKKEPGR